MLRKEVGDEDFNTAIRDYYKKYTLSNALSDDLKSVFEGRTGKDLDQFFKQWVYQAGQPEIEGSWKYRKGEVQINLEQVQSEDFMFDLEASAIFEDGSQERFTITVSEKKQKFSKPLDQKPVKIILDPDTWLLFKGSLSEK